jgi:hypothetical protein
MKSTAYGRGFKGASAHQSWDTLRETAFGEDTFRQDAKPRKSAKRVS